VHSARRKCNVARGTGRRMPTVWFGCMRSCVCTYGIVSRRTMCRETSCTYYCTVLYTTHAQCNAPPQAPPRYPPRCQGRSSALRWPARRCRLARRLAAAPTTTTMVNSTSMQHTSPTTNRQQPPPPPPPSPTHRAPGAQPSPRLDTAEGTPAPRAATGPTPRRQTGVD